ncbi:TipC family immunity protein [Bacillus aquiflavi]|uniref:TipC family immunity protein n=2 Tax=Bacillus aquiflavi TaxID=2672567 RepID=A0A6B3W1B5_9BACI|nr:TipC family immunity protein [Bacillus aquiflavi]MBA4538865.1 TipC family immunity protein [Bacillus aquiflavi]NEY83228.1 TipC family immunity protein [Bacillus aquiflavi]
MKKIAYTIIILVVVLGGIYLFKANQIKNVFDEMYYAEVKTVLGGYTSTSFQNLKVLKNIPENLRANYLPNQNREIYNDASLNSNEGMSIFFDKKEKTIEVIGIEDYKNE